MRDLLVSVLIVALSLVSEVGGDGSIYATTTMVSQSAAESIHRFFDSSSLSSDQRYLAYTELPITKTSNMLVSCNISLVEVSSASSARYEVIDRSFAWAAQLGAQVQFATFAKESVLLYNKITFPSSSLCDILRISTTYGNLVLDLKSTPTRCLQDLQLHAVTYNMLTKAKTNLQCPIYHTSQHWAIAPNIIKIQRTQRGYGLDWKHFAGSRVSWKALPGNAVDGLYLTNLLTGECQMIYTLQEIAAHVGIDSEQHEVFGFHTKLSHDAKHILFVMRTIETGLTTSTSTSTSTNSNTSSSLFTSFINQIKSPPKVRTQHLFILGTHEKSIRYVLSWASKPFLSTDPVNKLQQVLKLRDGNHPNWIGNTNDISMNLEVVAGQPQHDGWRTVRIIISNLPTAALPLFHQHFIFYKFHQQQQLCMQKTQNSLTASYLSSTLDKPLNCQAKDALAITLQWQHGMGHPTFHPKDNFFVTDAYGKEMATSSNKQGNNNSLEVKEEIVKSPLYLVSPASGKHVLIGEFPVQVSTSSNSILGSVTKYFTEALIGRKQDRSWRCDLHPAWSTDGNYLVHNLWNASTRRRQVALTTLDWLAVRTQLET